MSTSAAHPSDTPGPTTRATAAAEPLGRRLVRGAIGGIVAGIPFIVITMWFASTTGGGWLAPLNLISTVVLGADALQAGTAQPWVGVVVHTVISALLGMAFALVSPALRTNAAVAIAATVYGVLVYVVNFLIVANTVLPQFKAPNDPFELVMHTVFGTILGFFFYSSGVRRGEPFLAVGRR
jgi:uncharacterized membrane protein YagU involved in acid resistance